MARLIDVKIDDRVRERIKDAYKELDGELSSTDLANLAPLLGVQPRTLEGWFEGRGDPVPKATLGKLVYAGDIPDTWANRIVLGLALDGVITQTGSRGKYAEFEDDIGSAPLGIVLPRLLQYLTRDTGDEWIDVQWRKIRLEYGNSRGQYKIVVDYVRDYDSEFGT